MKSRWPAANGWMSVLDIDHIFSFCFACFVSNMVGSQGKARADWPEHETNLVSRDIVLL